MKEEKAVKKTEDGQEASVKAQQGGLRPEQIIIEPILSEKSNILRQGEKKKYTFVVHMDANKYQIMHAVKALFNVDCVKCNTMIFAGKPKRSRRSGNRRIGYTSQWKKAIVTLAKGQSITAIDNI